MSEAPDYDDYSEHIECWQCGGDGGWASCMEDCCPYEGGEEGCNDPACWRKCDICGGKGGWTREDARVHGEAQAGKDDPDAG